VSHSVLVELWEVCTEFVFIKCLIPVS